MISAMDISTSALVAQRIRMNAIASNLANISTTRNERGELEPFQARYVTFQMDEEIPNSQGAVGVKVGEIKAEKIEPVYRYQPNHPHAIQSGDKQGYVAYPNINMTAEFVDALEATRSYEANVGVIEITKNMSQQSLRILA